MLLIIWISYQNNFSKESFLILLINYCLMCFAFSKFSLFFRYNIIICLSLFIAFYLNDFNSEVPVTAIVSTITILFASGAFITLSRSVYKDRLKEREQLLNFIFNRSTDGLLLVDKRSRKILEVNNTAVNILRFENREHVINKEISEIKLDGQSLIEESLLNIKKSYELKDKRIITQEIKEVDYKSNDYYLVQLKEFRDKKDLNLSIEFETLKSYSEENYQSLFESSASFICIINKEDKILDANQTLASFLGFSKKEIIGSKLSGLDYENYDEERIEINKRAWQGSREQFEKTLVAKDGKLLHIEVILNKGKYFGEEVLISNSRDITQRKELREKANYNYIQYKKLFEQSPISIVKTNLSGVIKDVNQAFIHLLGMNRDELINQDIELISHPNDMDLSLALRKQLLDGDIPSIEMNKRYINKKGEILHTLVKAILEKDEKGVSKSFIAQIVDISDIIAAEEKIKSSETSYKDIFNNTYELLYVINKKNQFIDVNRLVLKKYGYTKEEIIGQYPDFLGAEGQNDPEEVSRKLNLVWEGEDQEMIWYSKKKDGTIFPKKLQLGRGMYFGEEVLICSGRDISEQVSYERKIEKSRKKYKELIDSSIAGVGILQGEEIVFANKKLSEILKVESIDQLTRSKIGKYIRKQDISPYNELIGNLKKTDNVALSEFVLVDSEQEEVNVEIRPKIIDYEGRDCIMISVLDLSDRKIAEEAQKLALKLKNTNESLKEQLEQNRLIQKQLMHAQAYTEGIIESSLDMIFTADKNGKINRLNPAAIKEFQLENEKEYLDESFGIFMKNESFASSILNRLAENKSFSGEVEMQRKDGSKFISFISISNLISTENQSLGIMGISRDISDLKKNENEIKKQASKLNAIIESSSHYFFTLDRDYQIKSFNSLFKEDIEERYNHSIEIGDNFFDLFKVEQDGMSKQEIRDFWEAHIKDCFNGKRTRFENQRKDINNKVFYREVYINPVYNKDGSIGEISCIAHDTTNQRLAEKELQNSLEEKNVLLKEVHHRVKNNMQVISSILNLQSYYVKDEETISMLRESQSRIRAMAAIHERLYSTENFSDIKFSSYIKNLAEEIINTYELVNKSIDLSCELEEVFLFLDLAIPCGLIINELISNSLKYGFIGRKKGLIEVSLKSKNDIVYLRVGDNGVGMPKDLDYRKSKSLGLQLVDTLIGQIEGTIELEEGLGTYYNITFSIKNK